MGVVYRATHLALDRPVALKVIASHLADDEGFRERFLRESRLSASLDHPNVVPVFDAREEDGELIVAMRLVEGGDLKRRIAAHGPLPPEHAIELLAQIAEALDAAHAAGIVHRDVKPHNILLEGDHRAYLTDFGLAKALGDSGVLEGASIAGTVEYMSPEQWQGKSVGPAADVYSLGCVLYEALTGIVPYARQADDTEPEIPEGLDSVIEGAVAKNPDDRFPTAGALIAAAREHQGDAPAATAVLSDTPGRPTAVIAPASRPWSERAKDRAMAGGRRRLIGAGAILAVILIAFVWAKLFAGDDVAVSDPIAIGEGPLRVATGEGFVWVTSAGDGTLSQVSPETLEPIETIELGEGVSGVAVGEGSVWVSSPRIGKVLRIDPVSGLVTKRIGVGWKPGAIAYGGGRVWVADGSGRGITAINAAGGRIVKRHILPRAAPLRLGVGAGGLWVSSASTGSVRRVDLGNPSAGDPVVVGRGPSGITVGGGVVWVANSRSDTVSRLDPASKALLGVTPVGGRPGGIDAGTSVVWVANAKDDTVSRLDIFSGETIGDPVEVGSEPGAIAVGEEAVWVADNGEGAITRIEP